MTAKIDFKRELDCYTAKRNRPQVVEVPDLQYLMLDGHGDPNTPVYTEAVSALYPVAYKLKFTSKKDLGRDYVVMPLEGLWWADDMATFTNARDKSQWDWTLMIMVPDWITNEMCAAAVDQVGGRTARRGSTICAWRLCRRASLSRPSTLAPTTTRANCYGRCTRSSSLVTASRWSASHTRSTSAIHAKPSRPSCGRSCGSR